MITEKFAAFYIDKQFEMIGEKFRYKDIPPDLMIEVGKKKMYWFEYYKFRDEAQWQEWRDWARDYMIKDGILNHESVLNDLDLVYGMLYKIPKEKGQGELAF
jgi:hypothetical protein